MINKNECKRDILKLLFYKFEKEPNVSIFWNIDGPAYEVEYKTKLIKFHIRIYDDKVLVFSSDKYAPYKSFEESELDQMPNYITELLTDSVDRF